MNRPRDRRKTPISFLGSAIKNSFGQELWTREAVSASNSRASSNEAVQEVAGAEEQTGEGTDAEEGDDEPALPGQQINVRDAATTNMDNNMSLPVATPSRPDDKPVQDEDSSPPTPETGRRAPPPLQDFSDDLLGAGADDLTASDNAADKAGFGRLGPGHRFDDEDAEEGVGGGADTDGGFTHNAFVPGTHAAAGTEELMGAAGGIPVWTRQEASPGAAATNLALMKTRVVVEGAGFTGASDGGSKSQHHLLGQVQSTSSADSPLALSLHSTPRQQPRDQRDHLLPRETTGGQWEAGPWGREDDNVTTRRPRHRGPHTLSSPLKRPWEWLDKPERAPAAELEAPAGTTGSSMPAAEHGQAAADGALGGCGSSPSRKRQRADSSTEHGPAHQPAQAAGSQQGARGAGSSHSAPAAADLDAILDSLPCLDEGELVNDVVLKVLLQRLADSANKSAPAARARVAAVDPLAMCPSHLPREDDRRCARLKPVFEANDLILMPHHDPDTRHWRLYACRRVMGDQELTKNNCCAWSVERYDSLASLPGYPSTDALVLGLVKRVLGPPRDLGPGGARASSSSISGPQEVDHDGPASTISHDLVLHDRVHAVSVRIPTHSSIRPNPFEFHLLTAFIYVVCPAAERA